MNAQEYGEPNADLTPAQQAMVELWEQHLKDEFELHDVDKTMETMVKDPFNTNVPVMTGGIDGMEYERFIPNGLSHKIPRIRTSR